jgi:hypothetical protein
MEQLNRILDSINIMSCSICLEELSTSFYIAGCGHSFHIACFDKWIIQKLPVKCPNCRMILQSKNNPNNPKNPYEQATFNELEPFIYGGEHNITFSIQPDIHFNDPVSFFGFQRFPRQFDPSTL